MSEKQHCDDVTEPKCLVDFINWQRLPAAAKIDDDYRKEVGGEEFKD